ncbi:hypothetical protein [Alicyclobacillus sp. SP_1]|uniref:hypothetical protein n=1 Tax=Alicyclobacillus sp. SP_1 TaxID=2942475 RepID=UPI002158116B|nr:hypothetical protein [Alicyclobacillus sp. SP_1]
MGRILRNINVLDLSATDETSLKDVVSIENVNLLLSKPELGPALSKISMRNINQTVEGISNIRMVNGRCEISATDAPPSEPSNIMINGTLVIQPDVTEKALSEQIGALLVNGSVVCPKRLEGALRSKIHHLNGAMNTYANGATTLLHNATFDAVFVRLLKPGSRIVAVGKSQLLAHVDTAILREKIDFVEFHGRVAIREDILEVLADCIQNPQHANFSVVPETAIYFPESTDLDGALLSRHSRQILYVNGDVHVCADVSSATLETSVSKLLATGQIFCHPEVQSTVQRLCEFDAKIVLIRGKLVRVDDEGKLTTSELELSQSEGGMTLVVGGVLEIADDVNPELLLASVHYVDNEGVILGSEAQCAAIRMKLRSNNGLIEQKEAELGTDQATDPNALPDSNQYVENVNILKL